MIVSHLNCIVHCSEACYRRLSLLLLTTLVHVLRVRASASLARQSYGRVPLAHGPLFIHYTTSVEATT
jgi:hypothetical protein